MPTLLHSVLRTPHSVLRIPNSALRTPHSLGVAGIAKGWASTTERSLESVGNAHPTTLRTPHSALRTPHSEFRTPHSALRIPNSALRTHWPLKRKLKGGQRPPRGALNRWAMPTLLHSVLRIPHSALRIPNSALRTPHSLGVAGIAKGWASTRSEDR